MATKKAKKRLAPKKPENREVTVLVPGQWGLPQADILKLEEELRPQVNRTLNKMGGEICVVTGVTNGVHPKH